jgi:hypothetical protein
MAAAGNERMGISGMNAEQNREPKKDARRERWSAALRFDVGAAVGRWLRGQAVLILGLALTGVLAYGYAHAWRHINGPEEWYWHYRPQLLVLPMLARAAAWLLPGAVVLGGLWLATRRLAPPWRGRLAMLLLLAWGLYYHAASWRTMHDSDPSLLGGTMLNSQATGFTTVAMQTGTGELPPLGETLREYPRFMKGAPLHVQTHPPGNVVLSALTLRWMRASPALAQGIERALSFCGTIFDWPSMRSRPAAERSAVMLVGLLCVAGGLLAAVPLFALVRLCGEGERTAWIAAVLWVHYPALLFFTPSYDQLYVPIVIAGLWAWRRGVENRPWMWGAQAGIAGGLGVFLSFKLLLWLPLFLLLPLLIACRDAGSPRPGSVLRYLKDERATARRLAVLTLAMGAGFAGFNLLLWLFTGIDMAAVFAAACANQVDLERMLNRSYIVWVWRGPLDALTLAAPVISLTALAAWARAFGQAFARGRRNAAALEPAFAIFPLGLAIVSVSGIIQAENARQLLMFGPGLIWAAARWIDRPDQTSGGQWCAGLVLVLIACFIFAAVGLNAMEFIAH